MGSRANFARIPLGRYPSHPSQPSIARPIQQQRGRHLDFESIKEPVYMDRDGLQVQPLHRRAFYDEGDRSGYVRRTIGYDNTNALALSYPPCKGRGPIWVHATPWLHLRRWSCLVVIGEPNALVTCLWGPTFPTMTM